MQWFHENMRGKEFSGITQIDEFFFGHRIKHHGNNTSQQTKHVRITWLAQQVHRRRDNQHKANYDWLRDVVHPNLGLIGLWASTFVDVVYRYQLNQASDKRQKFFCNED